MVASHRNSSSVSTVSDSAPEALINILFADLAEILCLTDLDQAVLSKIFYEQLKIAQEKKAGTTRAEVLGAAQRDCMELLCAWRRKDGYLDADAEPVALDFEGEAPSFRALCNEVGTRTSAEELRARLIEFNAVCIEPTGKIKPRTPTFLASESGVGRPVAIDTALRQLIGFTNTVKSNVATNDPRRFERCCTVRVPEEIAPIFERLVKERGQLLVDSLDEWLERRRNESSHTGRYINLGVGVYTIHET